MTQFTIGTRVRGPFGRGAERHEISGVIHSLGIDNSRSGSNGTSPLLSGGVTVDVPEHTADAFHP